jgi:hypothetical protein
VTVAGGGSRSPKGDDMALHVLGLHTGEQMEQQQPSPALMQRLKLTCCDRSRRSSDLLPVDSSLYAAPPGGASSSSPGRPNCYCVGIDQPEIRCGRLRGCPGYRQAVPPSTGNGRLSACLAWHDILIFAVNSYAAEVRLPVGARIGHSSNLPRAIRADPNEQTHLNQMRCHYATLR